jgi:deoxyribodipyrimidine photo-lyase
MSVPALRLREANGAPLRPDRELVLYWMIAARRTRWNFGLERAVELARELDRPLVVLEALRCGHRWASARFHRFVLDGMRDNARALEGTGVLYHPYVEPRPGEGSGLLEALAAHACAVVTDEFPCFFLPEMVQAAAGRLDVRLEVLDSSGLLPLRAPERVFTTAHSFRVHLQKELRPHLTQGPRLNPLARTQLRPLARLPRGITKRWPAASAELLEGSGGELARLPIDQEVAPTDERGGPEAGDRALKRFLDLRLARYGEHRNDVVDGAASGLSAYLHWGHVSVHQVLDRLGAHVGWSPDDVSRKSIGGKREGWWGVDPSTEAFLDELVTWREVGFQFCHKRADYDRFGSLPGWALDTLARHARDRRDPCYALDQLEAAETHDELWNAAQRQLRGEGRIHNYLRMLWGKKVLEWTASPEQALDALVELNNRWALDGRDPNSYSGIFWTLGRFDRAWGPERPVFGTVRYMSSDSTRRKLDVKPYLERWGEPGLFS